MPMRRRESHVTGAVKFPVDDPRYSHSHEGGMFVRAMVMETTVAEDPDLERCWMECMGGTCRVEQDAEILETATERLLWPRRFAEDGSHRVLNPEDIFSEGCLAVVTLGSTGWSGWAEDTQKYWQCHEDDLTGVGKAIVANLRELYPGRTVHLTTWLDT